MECYKGIFRWNIKTRTLWMDCVIEKRDIEEGTNIYQMLVKQNCLTYEFTVTSSNDYICIWGFALDKDTIVQWLNDKKEKAIKQRKLELEKELEELSNNFEFYDTTGE